MTQPSWLVRGAPHVWRPYCQHATAPPPLPVVGARGAKLQLADGRELVDGIASWWTAAHGYHHPHLRARVAQQLEQLPHVAFGGLAHEAAYSLAERLTKFLGSADGRRGPLERVFFTESGSVAVEVAVKIALQWQERRQPSRRKIVAFEGGYHGDTFATMSLCDPHDGMHRAFRGTGLESVHLPLPDETDAFERAMAALRGQVACVVVEPLLQGAGGMRLHTGAALRRMRDACDAADALLVFDEIAVGFHRLGPRFAFHEAEVVPDLLVLGKALTGGTLPLAATIASRGVFESFLDDDASRALQHGPTYMGNALACAAAHASLDLFEAGDYPARVAALEAKFAEWAKLLASAPRVREVRVRGAMLAVELPAGQAPPSSAFETEGAFVRPLRLAGADVVYVMPPLTIDEEELRVLGAALTRVLGA